MAVTLLKDVLTVQWLKDSYLQGLVLTDLQGVAFPDSLYADAIVAAVRHIEGVLDVRILPLKVGVERHTMGREQLASFWMFQLRRRPVRSIETIKARYGDQVLYDVPLGWIYQVMPVAGQVHILPNQQNITAVAVPIPTLMSWQGGYLPGGFEIAYTAGFVVLSGTATFNAGETTKTVTLPETLWDSGFSAKFTLLAPQPVDANITATVVAEGLSSFDMELSAPPANALSVQWIVHTLPADLLMLIGLQASLQPINVAGTTLLPPGYSSGSRSEDGLSESLSSTQNAQQLAYGNRRDAHQKLIDQLLPVVRGRYRSMNMYIH